MEKQTVRPAHIRRRRPELFGHEVADRDASVSTKSARTDPVTLADTEAETLIRRELARLRPDDAVLGEEEGGSVEVPAGARPVDDDTDASTRLAVAGTCQGSSPGSRR